VQAATSQGDRIAGDRTTSWHFAGDGSGARGKAGAAKAKSLDGLPNGNPAVSKFPTMWPRESRSAVRRRITGWLAVFRVVAMNPDMLQSGVRWEKSDERKNV